MTHTLLQRLTDVKIQNLEGLIGETIINLAEYDVLYLVMSSGKWCKLTSDDQEEYSAYVFIAEGQTEQHEVKLLAELGMVSATEMEEWESYLAASLKEAQNRQRLRDIEHMHKLIDLYPKAAREFLDAKPKGE